MLTRRDFIKMLGAISTVIVNPFNKLLRWGLLEVVEAEESPGELYAGFVLLPEGASIPPFVQCAPAPILGQVEDGQEPDALAIRGETIWFDDLTELISQVSFITYIPNSLPSNMRFIQGNIIRFTQSGEIFAVGIDYGSVNGKRPLISVSARPIFPRPYPIWPIDSPLWSRGFSDREQKEMVLVNAEKYDFTPTPGAHGTCAGGTSPVDIAYINGSLDLYLRVNYPTIKSIKTFVELRCCAGCANQYRRTMKVELYECPNAIYYIGAVMYAHVDNPQVSNNTVYNLTSSSRLLGTVPAGSCGSCYTGRHSHMERSGGSTIAPCCAVGVTTSTNIYSWTFSPHAYCPASADQ